MELGRLPGVVLSGSGAYFPPRDVTNDEILDHVLAHYFVRADRAGIFGRAHHAAARVAGQVGRRVVRHKYPTTGALLARFGMPEDALDRLGVARRQWAHPVGSPPTTTGDTSASMACEAARAAIADAGLTPADLDVMLVTTTTPPRLNSSTALWIAEKLETRCPAYDLRAGCSGGLYGILQAAMWLQHGAKHVLVVGAEAYSRFIPDTNRDAIFVAGDGAGAVVLSRSDDPELGILASISGADGKYDARFFTRGPMPPTAEAVLRGHYIVEGDPRRMVDASLRKYLEIVPRVLALAGTTPADIGYHVPHQTSRAVIEAVARHVGLSMDDTFVNIGDHGNIGSACLLAGLHEARQRGRLRPGEKLLASVVGGTLTWAALVLQQ